MLAVKPPLDLPKEIPIFPLAGVVLMPFGQMPLTIFEPRYINMVDDALGQGRLIAMVQPRGITSEPIDDTAPLYDVATLGRIIQFQDPGNGHYHIILEGLTRFRIKRKLDVQPSHGYRTVEADYSAYPYDMNPTEQDDGPGRGRILELMKNYFVDQDFDTDWEAVAEAPYEALVSSLVMSCPFAPEEKQALLECEAHQDRAKMLISLFEMSIAQGGGGITPQLH